MGKGPFRLNALQVLALGFALIILAGALLLMLPIANRGGRTIPFINALFTSASAACVTGLVVYDTATEFTFFGQLVILLLIQIGGLGFMTVGGWVLSLLRRRIGLVGRTFLMESVSSLQLGGVVRLVRRIALCTGIFEGAGALLLSIRFIPAFGPRGIWYALFHSVSAFCNAGFDLMGGYNSFTGYAEDPLVCLTLMTLIVVGGVGFIVWDDLAECKLHFKEYRLHTKLVLCATGILIFSGGALFLLIEGGNTMASLSPGGKVLAALFQSVTCRTAGFNTVDTASLSGAGKGLSIFLMFVGAGAGSTAGGVKITTFAVLVLATVSYARGYEDINAFNRRLEKRALQRCCSSATLYLFGTLLGAFLLLLQGLPMEDVLFEAFSATGTVGLSTGVTRALSGFSRLVVILMMYSGRLGSLSVAIALAEKKLRVAARNPEEKILIG